MKKIFMVVAVIALISVNALATATTPSMTATWEGGKVEIQLETPENFSGVISFVIREEAEDGVGAPVVDAHLDPDAEEPFTQSLSKGNFMLEYRGNLNILYPKSFEISDGKLTRVGVLVLDEDEKLPEMFVTMFTDTAKPSETLKPTGGTDTAVSLDGEEAPADVEAAAEEEVPSESAFQRLGKGIFSMRNLISIIIILALFGLWGIAKKKGWYINL